MLVLLSFSFGGESMDQVDLPSPLFSDRAEEAEVSKEGFYEKPEFWLSVAIFVLFVLTSLLVFWVALAFA